MSPRVACHLHARAMSISRVWGQDWLGSTGAWRPSGVPGAHAPWCQVASPRVRAEAGRSCAACGVEAAGLTRLRLATRTRLGLTPYPLLGTARTRATAAGHESREMLGAISPVVVG